MQVRPTRLNTAVASSFMVGSACFIVGSVQAYADQVGPTADAVTYFIGSIFFTLASFGQLAQADSPGMQPHPDTDGHALRLVKWTGFLPHRHASCEVTKAARRGFLAAATQFPGTLFFNVSTFFGVLAVVQNNDVQNQVWRPDLVGCVLFLVASGFALASLGPLWRSFAPRSLPWRIGWLNMLGSVAFMVSAIGAYVSPSTGTYLNLGWAVAGTIVGGVCFLLGARLMIPEFKQMSAPV